MAFDISSDGCAEMGKSSLLVPASHPMTINAQTRSVDDIVKELAPLARSNGYALSVSRRTPVRYVMGLAFGSALLFGSLLYGAKKDNIGTIAGMVAGTAIGYYCIGKQLGREEATMEHNLLLQLKDQYDNMSVDEKASLLNPLAPNPSKNGTPMSLDETAMLLNDQAQNAAENGITK